LFDPRAGELSLRRELSPGSIRDNFHSIDQRKSAISSFHLFPPPLTPSPYRASPFLPRSVFTLARLAPSPSRHSLTPAFRSLRYYSPHIHLPSSSPIHPPPLPLSSLAPDFFLLTFSTSIPVASVPPFPVASPRHYYFLPLLASYLTSQLHPRGSLPHAIGAGVTYSGSQHGTLWYAADFAGIGRRWGMRQERCTANGTRCEEQAVSRQGRQLQYELCLLSGMIWRILLFVNRRLV